MKFRILSTLLTVVILLMLLPITAAASSGEVIDSYGNVLPYLQFYSSTEGRYKTIIQMMTENADTAERVIIPQTINGYPVTEICDIAFYRCINLQSIHIPSSVESIWVNSSLAGVAGFAHCEKLSSITVTQGGAFFKSVDGILFNSDYTVLVCFPRGQLKSSYTIPDTIVSIDDCAFANSSISTLHIPTSVRNISWSAFIGCDALSDIYYDGSEDEWGAISIDSGNDALINATIHYANPGVNVRVDVIAEKTIFNDHTYQLLWSDYGWDQMEAYSKTINAHLACITSSEENTFLYDYIKQYNVKNAVFGFSDFGNEGDWAWVSGELTDYTNWAPGEPNNELGDEHWAHYYEDYPMGQWNDCQYPGSCYYLVEWDYDDSIRFDRNSYTLAAGDDLILVAYVPTVGGLTQGDFTYTSSDESVVSIVESGVLIADNASAVVTVRGNTVGTSIITVATTDGRSAYCEVTVTDSKYYIKLYADTPSLTNLVGDSMDLLCQLYKNDERVTDWDSAAFAIGNNKILSVSKQKWDSVGYHLTVRGISEGTTSLTVTDMDSDAFTTINLTFVVNSVSPDGYMVYNVPVNYYPSNPLTNFYNINGLYVNNYQYTRRASGGYDVSFNVYNTQYMYGAVDVYNADGDWIASEEIEKFTNITSLWDTGEALFYLIYDCGSGDILTSYTAHIVSVKTPISITVPDGGYFTISNNFVDSPGAFLFNEVDYLTFAVETAIGYGVDGIERYKVWDYFKNHFFVDESFSSTVLAKAFEKGFRQIAAKTIGGAIEFGYGKAFNVSLADFEDLLESMSLGSIKDVFQVSVGIGENLFEMMAGPPGAVLESLFSVNKLLDLFKQAMQVCGSMNKPYVTIYTTTCPPIQGVTVTTSENSIDSEAILQVFRIDNGRASSAVVNHSEYYDQQETYSIRFIQDGKEVQPSGKTTVRLPVPEGYDKNACIVLRQEDDGDWTIMDSTLEGDYLVFETEHFSIYSVVTTNTANAIILDTSEERGNISTKIYCKEEVECIAYCAYYDSDGRMLSIETYELAAGIVNDCLFTNISAATRAKIFILDSAGIPQCPYSFIAVSYPSE